jgi:AbrB family looped-hinge helix DNA binding protein
LKSKNLTITFVESRISSKGQITIPAKIRKKLGLRTGTAMHIESLEDGIMIRKTTQLRPVDRLYGTLNLARSVDTSLDDMRGPRNAVQRLIDLGGTDPKAHAPRRRRSHLTASR